MPKDIIRTKKDNQVFHTKPPRKFKIGGRKGGKSANIMSSADLIAVLENSGKSRYHPNARAVLALRGVAA